jgi:hypothetical protein
LEWIGESESEWGYALDCGVLKVCEKEIGMDVS